LRAETITGVEAHLLLLAPSVLTVVVPILLATRGISAGTGLKVALLVPILVVVMALGTSRTAWGNRFSGVGRDVSNSSALLDGAAVALFVIPIATLGILVVSRMRGDRGDLGDLNGHE
jgi:predicted small secreted protein